MIDESCDLWIVNVCGTSPELIVRLPDSGRTVTVGCDCALNRQLTSKYPIPGDEFALLEEVFRRLERK